MGTITKIYFAIKETFKLKTYINIVTLVALTVLLFACSDNNQGTDNSQEAETPEINEEAVVKYDFRKANWGMSMQEVKDSEEIEPVLESENTLDFSTILLNMQAQIGYTFKDDELIRAGFFFVTELNSENEYLEKYEALKDELTKVNGRPVIDTEQQKDPSQQIDPDDKGKAVCNGDLLYAAQWDLPNTDIQLVLRGEEAECKLTILYISEEGLRQMLKDRANRTN